MTREEAIKQLDMWAMSRNTVRVVRGLPDVRHGGRKI